MEPPSQCSVCESTKKLKPFTCKACQVEVNLCNDCYRDKRRSDNKDHCSICAPPVEPKEIRCPDCVYVKRTYVKKKSCDICAINEAIEEGIQRKIDEDLRARGLTKA